MSIRVYVGAYFMRFVFCALTKLTLAIMCSFPALTSFANETIVAHFSTSNVKPWGFVNKDGVQEGLLIRLVHALENELEVDADNRVKIDNHIRPYPRVIHEIKTGAVDFAAMFNSPQSNQFGISIGKITDSKILIVGLSDKPRISSIDQLENRPIGHIRGSKYGPLFDDNKTLNKISLDSMERGIKMLLKGRIYALASADQTLYYALERLKIPSQRIKPMMTVSEVSVELYFSKASAKTELIHPISDALSKLKSKGVLDTIFYQEGYIPKTQVNQ